MKLTSLLFNPFIRVAGTKALLIGLLAMSVTAIVCFLSNTHFDGVVDAHTGLKAPLFCYFVEPVIMLGLPVVFFYSVALIFSRSSIRFIDVAGTLALARWPMIFAAICGFGLKGHTGAIHDINEITPVIVAISLVELLITIWMIVMMYNAFKVSCNVKGISGNVIFIVVLLFVEVISHVISNEFYKYIRIV